MGFRAIELTGKEGFAPLVGMMDPDYQAENEVAATLQRQVGLCWDLRNSLGQLLVPLSPMTRVDGKL